MENHTLQAPEQSPIQQDLIVRQEMAQLEQDLAAYVGAPHCVSVESATTGLLLALKAMDIGAGDTVLCTSFSYASIPEVIALSGAKPVLVDINPNTYNIDPYCLDYMIGRCVRSRQEVPKALIAVDLFGLPCNYDDISEICERHGIQLIEDMAQSFGASYKGQRTGSFGRMAVASFFPARPINEEGEGGAVFCHTRQDVLRLEALRRKIRLHQDQRVLYNTGGYLDAVQSSVVIDKLEKFDAELESRRKVAAQYAERLGNQVKIQQLSDDYESAYTQFAVSVKNFQLRSSLLEYLDEHKIPCQVFDPSPVYRPGHEDWSRLALVNARAVAQKILALPIHPFLSRKIVDHICDHVLAGLEQCSQPALH